MIISQHGKTAATPLTFLDRIDHVGKQVEYLTGHPFTFAAAVFFVAIWAGTGPLFHFGQIWQFTLGSVTSIVTFLMVFLIQNTESRTRAALQLKLDELIRSTRGAHNVMLTLEDMSLEEIEQYRAHYEKLATTAREKLKHGQADTGTPEITIG
ncbi:MAG: low affinity iron permease family protein [Nitrospirota bacterium]